MWTRLHFYGCWQALGGKIFLLLPFNRGWFEQKMMNMLCSFMNERESHVKNFINSNLSTLYYSLTLWRNQSQRVKA